MEGPWDYGVDSYQIPVPLGECSIHFLVRRQSGLEAGKAKEKPRIQVAILVDGGEPTEPACAAIVHTLKALESEYGEYPGSAEHDPFPGFTFWLVTHWDDDHYLGALQYFSTILKDHPKRLVAASVPVDHSKWGADTKNRSVSRAKRQPFMS